MNKGVLVSERFLVHMYSVWSQCLLQAHLPNLHILFWEGAGKAKGNTASSSQVNSWKAELQNTRDPGVPGMECDATHLLISLSPQA